MACCKQSHLASNDTTPEERRELLLCTLARLGLAVLAEKLIAAAGALSLRRSLRVAVRPLCRGVCLLVASLHHYRA